MIFTSTTTLNMQGGRKENKEEEEESRSEGTCGEIRGDGCRYVQSYVRFLGRYEQHTQTRFLKNI
jgi:hypothetical protein